VADPGRKLRGSKGGGRGTPCQSAVFQRIGPRHGPRYRWSSCSALAVPLGDWRSWTKSDIIGFCTSE